MDPLVSVIVPCFNGAQYLEQAVKSVLAQTFTNLECIIVDDGSTDNTRQVSESLVSKDSRVKYFYKDNGGAASARNFAIERAKGEWIQFLDADDWLDKDKIGFQLSYLDTFGPIEAVFYSDYEIVYQDGNQNIVNRVTITTPDNWSNEQLLEKRVVVGRFGPDFPAPIWSLLIRKTVFRKKMMNENFELYDDLEFIIDILLKGVPFIHTPIVGVSYRRHSSQLTRMPRRKREKDYVLLMECVYEKDKSMVLHNPNVAKLIKNAIKEKDRGKFNGLINLIDTRHMPICFSNGRIKIKSKLLLKVAFLLRLFVPLSVPRTIWRLYCRFQTVLHRTARHFTVTWVVLFNHYVDKR